MILMRVTEVTTGRPTGVSTTMTEACAKVTVAKMMMIVVMTTRPMLKMCLIFRLHLNHGMPLG